MAQRKASSSLGGLLGALAAAAEWLEACHVPFAVVGGVAASLHGKPRVTKDVDIVAIAENAIWPSLLARAPKWGLAPRIDDALAFAQTTRVLLLVHQPTRIEVDLSFGMLPFEHSLIERAEFREVQRVRFPMGTAEDIVIMKALAMRPRDIADIENIVQLVPTLDLERIRTIVAQLSAALEGEDHLSQLDLLLKAQGPR
jgi:predicted nucleotidyltransferase